MRSHSEPSRVGKRGTVVIPAALRKRFGLSEGAFLIAEETKSGILLRPATLKLVDLYDNKKKASYLLSNAVDSKDYAEARKEVRKMGLDPNKIKHHKIN